MHVNVATGDQRKCETLPESGESRELVAVASISMQFGSDPQAAGITLTQPRQLVEFIRIARYPQQAAIGERRVDIVAQQPKIGRAHVELQSLMRISYAVFCLKKKTHHYKQS